MINSNKLYNALEMSVKDMNATYDENESISHRFSWRYRRKKRAIIKAYQQSLQYPEEFDHRFRKIGIRQRVHIAILVAVTALLLTGAGVVVTYYIGGIRAEQQSTHTDASAFNLEGAPTKLEKKYRLTFDLSEYNKGIMNDDYNMYWEYYEKDEEYFDFSYYTKSVYQNSRLNTEGTNIEMKQINNYEALYFVREDGTQCLLWDNGEYIFEVIFSIDYTKMEEILKTITEI